ncbi:hypothetical protein BBP40_001915 [Aspergillus hancockii]|nr:hypothetical protein BBP40_001915 [Aspergillus hancockii]
MYQEVVVRMYLLAAVYEHVDGVVVPDWEQMSYDFHKWWAVCGILGWASFNSVKFSFLFLFKRMIDRMRVWRIYWWAVVVFTTGLVVYGFAAVYLSCPYFYDPRQFQCAERRAGIIHSTLVISLDIVGDLLILVIPIAIIWQVQFHWIKKIILGCSLCVAVIMIILMITRVAGLVHGGAVDINWNIFWHYLNAEIAVLLTSAVAFRALFVARKHSNAQPSPPYSIKRGIKKSLSRSNRGTSSDTPGDSRSAVSQMELTAVAHSDQVEHGSSPPVTPSGEGIIDHNTWPLPPDPVLPKGANPNITIV